MIEARPPRLHPLPLPPTAGQPGHPSDPVTPPTLVTPSGTSNPEPPGSGAPLMLALHRLDLPILTGHDPLTPSPTPGGISVASI
jgi:tRNA-dihydrouridine synthase 2